MCDAEVDISYVYRKLTAPNNSFYNNMAVWVKIKNTGDKIIKSYLIDLKIYYTDFTVREHGFHISGFELPPNESIERQADNIGILGNEITLLTGYYGKTVDRIEIFKLRIQCK